MIAQAVAKPLADEWREKVFDVSAGVITCAGAEVTVIMRVAQLPPFRPASLFAVDTLSTGATLPDTHAGFATPSRKFRGGRASQQLPSLCGETQMWIFLKNAFVSITNNEKQPGTVLLRARLRGDLENLLPGVEVWEDAGTDYRFRASLSVEEVGGILTERISEIDYTSFTGSVDPADRARMCAYQKILGVMRDSQAYTKTLEEITPDLELPG